MAEEKIIDYISGIEVPAGPEETQATQPFSRRLVEDYGYPKSEIQTRPQLKVKASPSDPGSYPVDIAVFENKGKANQKLKIIVECKQKTRKDGLDQLKIYLKFSEANIGIWFNGEESLFIRKIEQSGNITFEEIPEIPKYKESIEEIGKYRRKDLKPTHNLKEIFKELRGNIVANGNAVRDEDIAENMINLVLCKIYDERFTAPDDLCTFRAEISESDTDIKERMTNLFCSVKSKYSDVLKPDDEITFDGKTLRIIISKIQNFCIRETERDVVSDAFEVFIGKSLKGEEGQFFTPINVVKMMVQYVKPNYKEMIIDPSCGSGGFLVESLKQLWAEIDNEAKKYKWTDSAADEEKRNAAIKCIRGIDKDPFLAKIAKAYMAILGDGKGGICCEDSLDLPDNWQSSTTSLIGLGRFDVVLANPPFGKNIKVEGKSKLSQFVLARKEYEDGKSGPVDKGIVSTLFLERTLQLLKKGGRLGIILPETYFHAPSAKYANVRDFIFKSGNVQCLIDLPHNTFRPYNNAKCLILIMQKGVKQQEYIDMAVAQEIGHDHNGLPKYRLNEDMTVSKELWDDTKIIMDEWANPSKEKTLTFKIKAEEVIRRGILVPRYYWNSGTEMARKEAQSKGCYTVSLQQLIDEGVIQTFDGNGSPEAQFKGQGEIPYVRVADIVNWQVYLNVTSLIPENEYQRLYDPKKQLMPKDILYVRRGSYRIGSVAMASPYNLKCILTREILVIRLIDDNNKYGLTPEYLLYALSTKVVSDMAKNKIFIDTTLPNIADRWREIEIPIFKNPVIFSEVKNRAHKAIQNQWDSLKEIDEFRKKFGVYNV